MDDFSDLAARVAAAIGELRGCLILSRDGLVLGAFPAGEDSLVKPAWLRFAALGEPEKGFVEYGEEIWVYARRGPYAAFAVVAPQVRPGLVMDQLEQALLTAEDTRSKRETMRVPEAPSAPSGKPRTSLHPEVKPAVPAPDPLVVHAEPVAAQGPSAPSAPPPTPSWARTSNEGPDAGGPEEAPATEPSPWTARAASEQPVSTSAEAPAAAPAAPTPSPEPAAETGEEEGETDTEVDRVMLAQEFSRLLQDDEFRDEE
jgi:hypothetical protein